MKLAVVTTGGTIGSMFGGPTITIDGGGARLKAEIEALARTAGAEVCEVAPALNAHSESLGPSDWAAVLGAVAELRRKGVLRIIVTHGTDTLCYTAAALDLLFGAQAGRIVVTGSFLAPGHPRSDARANLLAALSAAASDDLAPGVYVAFRGGEGDERAAILPAFAVKPMGFDETGFRAAFGESAATWSRETGLRVEAPSGPRPFLGGEPPSAENLGRAAARVHLALAHPGLDLSFLEAKPDLAALVVSLYHSGTASALGAPGSIMDVVKRGRTPVLMAAYPERALSAPYDSTAALIAAGAHVFRDLQPHFLYAACVIGLAQGRTVASVLKCLEAWLCKRHRPNGPDAAAD